MDRKEGIGGTRDGEGARSGPARWCSVSETRVDEQALPVGGVGDSDAPSGRFRPVPTNSEKSSTIRAFPSFALPATSGIFRSIPPRSGMEPGDRSGNEIMRTWDRLSATFVRGLKRPGKFYDGGGLMLQANATATEGVVTKAWLYRFQINKRERVMGLGSARVVTLAEARAKANEARKLLAAGIDPMTRRNADAWPLVPPSCTPRRSSNASTSCSTATATSGARSTRAIPQFDGGLLQAADGGCGRRHRHHDGPQGHRTRMEARAGDHGPGAPPHWRGAGLCRGARLRKPGPLPTRWKNHLDKLLPHPREMKPVVHHPALRYDAVPACFAKLIATDAIPELCLAFTILTATRSQESRGASGTSSI